MGSQALIVRTHPSFPIRCPSARTVLNVSVRPVSLTGKLADADGDRFQVAPTAGMKRKSTENTVSEPAGACKKMGIFDKGKGEKDGSSKDNTAVAPIKLTLGTQVIITCVLLVYTHYY